MLRFRWKDRALDEIQKDIIEALSEATQVWVAGERNDAKPEEEHASGSTEKRKHPETDPEGAAEEHLHMPSTDADITGMAQEYEEDGALPAAHEQGASEHIEAPVADEADCALPAAHEQGASEDIDAPVASSSAAARRPRTRRTILFDEPDVAEGTALAWQIGRAHV